jgi:hypothetical protein
VVFRVLGKKIKIVSSPCAICTSKPLRMMELDVDGTFKRRLKLDATPNVPLASPDPKKKNGETSCQI